jgi:hypothetical protein
LRNPDGWLFVAPPHEKLPGNPEEVVDHIQVYLAKAGAPPSEIGTSREELSSLLEAGYLYVSARLLEQLRTISQTKRCTEYESMVAFMSRLGPQHHVLVSAEEAPKMRATLEEQHPYERDIAAIRYYLDQAGASLEQIGGSESELKQLVTAFQAR